MVLALLTTARADAQEGYTERAKKYVEQYYKFAISEQKISGVPASVTLGQGILETEAGASELMMRGNNHFGIKCKTGWEGDTIRHTDDAKDECFKKYNSALESYHDHSEHLRKNPRYSSLFSISIKDYASWASGLRRCGYATDPQYARRLIKIIEDFGLQSYTLAAMDSAKTPLETLVAKQQTPAPKQPQLVDKLADSTQFVLDKKDSEKEEEEEDVEEPATPTVATPVTKQPVAVVESPAQTKPEPEPDPIRRIADSARNLIVNNNSSNDDTLIAPAPKQMVYDTTGIVRVHGLKAFYVHKDEMLLEYAMKYNVRYPKLLEVNDLADGPVPANSYIYLEKKTASGVNTRHIVEEGETLWLISQIEGIQLKRLTALNLMSPDENPVPGTVLQLQFPAARKPDVKISASAAHKTNAIVLINKDDKAAAIAQDSADYIPLKTRPDTFSTDGFINNTDTTDIPVRNRTADKKGKKPNNTKVQPRPKVAPLPIPTAPQPIPQKSDAVVIITPNAPGDKNAPVHWVTTDTVKKETPRLANEYEQGVKNQELAELKAQLDKVVYADDSKLVEKIQSEQTQQKAPEEQQEKNSKFYVVKKGDTASSIARKNNITVNQLLKWNDIDATDIKIGKKLKIAN